MSDAATPRINIGNHDYAVLAGSVGPEVIDIRKLYADTGMFTYDPGFTSTASCESALTYIDGDEGVLLHRGYPIGELADRIAAMEQHAFIAIDIGKCGFAARRRGEAGIVGENVGIAIQPPDVDHLRPLAAAEHGKFERLVLVGEGRLSGRNGLAISHRALSGLKRSVPIYRNAAIFL